MSDFYNNALDDPFGSRLFASLDKLEEVQKNFNVSTRIDVFNIQQNRSERLPLLYFKNRWLTDQLEVKELVTYKDNKQVSSAVIATGIQK